MDAHGFLHSRNFTRSRHALRDTLIRPAFVFCQRLFLFPLFLFFGKRLFIRSLGDILKSTFAQRQPFRIDRPADHDFRTFAFAGFRERHHRREMLFCVDIDGVCVWFDDIQIAIRTKSNFVRRTD